MLQHSVITKIDENIHVFNEHPQDHSDEIVLMRSAINENIHWLNAEQQAHSVENVVLQHVL